MLALVPAACGRDDDSSGGGGGGGSASADPGITDKEIKLGGSYPFSGPASAYGTIAKGAEAYFDFVNDKGGVDGRKINFKTIDDGYEPPRALQNAKRLIQQDKVFALFNTLGTPNNLAIWDYVNQQKVPHLFVATGASDWGKDIKAHPYTIGWQPNYVTEARVYAEYLKKEKPNAKVAVLYQNDGFGKDLLGGFEEAIEDSGIKVVDKEPYNVTDPTVAAQVGPARTLGGRHVPEHHDAEVLRPGDRDDRQERLEAAAHPQQRRRLEDARAHAGRAREREGHRLHGLLQGPRGRAVGRRRGGQGVPRARSRSTRRARTATTRSRCTAGRSRRRWPRRSSR